MPIVERIVYSPKCSACGAECSDKRFQGNSAEEARGKLKPVLESCYETADWGVDPVVGVLCGSCSFFIEKLRGVAERMRQQAIGVVNGSLVRNEIGANACNDIVANLMKLTLE